MSPGQAIRSEEGGQGRCLAGRAGFCSSRASSRAGGGGASSAEFGQLSGVACGSGRFSGRAEDCGASFGAANSGEATPRSSIAAANRERNFLLMGGFRRPAVTIRRDRACFAHLVPVMCRLPTLISNNIGIARRPQVARKKRNRNSPVPISGRGRTDFRGALGRGAIRLNPPASPARGCVLPRRSCPGRASSGRPTVRAHA